MTNLRLRKNNIANLVLDVHLHLIIKAAIRYFWDDLKGKFFCQKCFCEKIFFSKIKPLQNELFSCDGGWLKANFEDSGNKIWIRMNFILLW